MLFVSSSNRMVTIIIAGPSFNHVKVKGSWDEWNGEIEMTKKNEKFIANLLINPGKYEFKFIVDDEWYTADEYPIANTNGFQNNILIVQNKALKQNSLQTEKSYPYVFGITVCVAILSVAINFRTFQR